MQTTASPASDVDRQEADHARIRELLTGMATAWNAGDAEAYGALFTPDARYVDVHGGVCRARDEIVGSHRLLFEKLAGSRMTSGDDADREITFLTPDVAVVLGVGGGTTLPDRSLTAERISTVSLVALRTGAGWRFAHFQNTR